jgi:hypothetical protein
MIAAFARAEEIAMIAHGTAAEGERCGQRAALARKRDRISRRDVKAGKVNSA